MNDLRQAAALICIVIAGGFLFLLGAIFMTGVRLDNFGDIAVFVVWNGLVIAIVVVGIRKAISKENQQDESL